jgi:TonB-dependent receptor
MNYAHQFANEENGKKFLKVGYYTDYRNRSFESRYFSYTYPGFFDPVVYDSLIRLGVSSIFSPENFKTEDGLIIEEGTRPIDSYKATNLLVAGYVASDLTFGKTNVSGGVRIEQNIQTMNSRDDFGPIVVNNPILSILPSLNAGYNITKKSIVRAGYGRTVNRPEFRELAPFLFYDYKLESSRVGNPDLKTATIDNFDLRYEFYPRPGETYSIGGFYKRFKNPIEDRLILTTEQSSLTYVNADYAYNYGVEVEIKQSLKDIFASSFLNKLTLNLNASYIFSEVDLGVTAVAQDRVRSLQGQAPYIVNAAVYYNNNKSGINASLVYNVFGRNIFAVGDVSFPTIYELERHSLDFTIGKSFKSGVNAKFGIQNILNFPYRFYQDSNRDAKIDTSVDHPIFEFRRGSLFTFSLSYNFLGGKK